MVETQDPSLSPAEPTGGYTGKVVRGGAWNVAGSAVGYSLVVARVAILARLLQSAHFGVFAMVFAIMATIDLFARLVAGGLETIVVQRRTMSERALQAVWTIKLIRNAAMAAVLLGISLALSLWTGNGKAGDPGLLRELPTLLCWGALAIMVSAMASPGMSVLTRRMHFRKEVLAGTTAAVITVTGTCLAAWRWPGPGALMLGLVLREATRAVVSYAVFRFRPGLVWDRELVGEMLRFGRSVAWIQAMASAMSQLDNLIVGWLRGKVALGHYAMSYNVVSMPVHRVSQPVNRAVFAAFSRMQDSAERMSRALVRTVRVLAGLAGPAMIGVSVMSPEVVGIVLGSRWAPAAPLVAVLAMAGLFRALSGCYGVWIVAVGRPTGLARLKVCETVFFVGLVMGLTWYAGALGAAWAALIVYALDYFLTLVFVGRINRGVLAPLLGTLGRTAACCCLMAGTAFALRSLVQQQALWVRAALPSILGAVVYCTAVWFWNRGLWDDLIAAWRSLRAGGGPQADGGGAGKAGMQA